MKSLIVIPARGGSKRIPRKNVRIMCGKPLICYSIENANALKEFMDVDVAVSTDDEELGSIVENRGVEVIKRPKELATDKVTLDPVIFHSVNYMEQKKRCKYDTVITMQATSPTLKKSTIKNAIEFFEKSEWDTIISAMNKPHLSWGVRDGKIVKNYEKRLNSQELPANYLETGGFLITRRECVTENGRIGDKVNIFEISENKAFAHETKAELNSFAHVFVGQSCRFFNTGSIVDNDGSTFYCPGV